MEYERDNRTVGELEIAAREIRSNIARIDREAGGPAAVNGALRTERENLREKALDLDVRAAEGKRKQAALLRMAGDTSRSENVNDQYAHLAGSALIDEPRGGQPLDLRERVSGALRVIQREHSSGSLTDERALQLDSLVRNDRLGADSRYLQAVSAPEYRNAFRRLIADPSAQYSLREKERAALVAVSESMMERAALGIGAGGTGAFAVPFTLDPTVIAASDGTANPLRAISRLIQISTSDWLGVSSEGVTASFSAEGTEVDDNSPTLLQPTIHPERATSFVPFSIEINQDWSQLEQELFIAFRDAKDILEGTKFTLGAGHASEEPEGLITGITGASIMETISVGSVAVDDVYAMKSALPPRYRANARWCGNGSVLDSIRRLVGLSDPTEPALWVDGDPPRLLNRPAHELSDMDGVIAAGQFVLAYGDFSRFAVVDRVGMAVELVPHLFGTSHRPTGQRGLLAIWRTSSGVLVPEAFKVLKVKTTA